MRRSASGLISAPKEMEPFSKPPKFPRLSSQSSGSLNLPFLPHPTQLPPRPISGPKTYGSPFNSRLWLFCAFFLLMTCFSLYGFSLFKGFQFSNQFSIFKNRGYIIIIDAGSSGSRAHVFHYINEGPLPLVSFSDRENWSLKTKPGLSSFANDPHNAGESLEQLLIFASSKVPKRQRADTRIYLMATAGLRRLDTEIQESILESCRAKLRTSEFKFLDEWASIITGTDEGVFAWIAANYALGTLGKDMEDTVGIIELGGASAQVTFVPDALPPPEYLHTFDLGERTYPLYTHSFLHLGQEAAWDGLMHQILSGALKSSYQSVEKIVDPCTPKGFIMSSEELSRRASNIISDDKIKVSSILSAGNFSECKRVAAQFLQIGRDRCVYHSCAIGSTYVPKMKGRFFATENFFYTSQFFGLLPRATLMDIQNAGQYFCEEEWSKLQEKHGGIAEEDLLKYCFSSAYIVALLHDSLGLAMHNHRVTFTNQVGKVPLDWALGALIVKIREDAPPETSVGIFDEYKAFLPFLIVAFIIGFGVLIFYWQRKPNLKIIYDLEKGKYITTAVRTVNKR
ncbi:hypothetical protein KP509_12G075400 [Ceratopteris richardii]|uniref:Apyrase n=1 Tax=Ceratopteris richardii TaxID=49495 RepID=A0A8T2TQ31_CERRI|nr:hypothetical protein KP509_12G075400 [Ceratopteris richardii]